MRRRFKIIESDTKQVKGIKYTKFEVKLRGREINSFNDFVKRHFAFNEGCRPATSFLNFLRRSSNRYVLIAEIYVPETRLGAFINLLPFLI